MIELDWTLYVQLINFLLLVFLLNLVLFRPIRNALRERQARLLAEEADINLLTVQGGTVENEVKEKMLAARKEGAATRESLKQEGSKAESSLLDQVKGEVDQEWARVEKKIQEDMIKARDSLAGQVQAFAQMLASKILGRELS